MAELPHTQTIITPPGGWEEEPHLYRLFAEIYILMLHFSIINPVAVQSLDAGNSILMQQYKVNFSQMKSQ